MQETRRQILNILQEREQATVDEIVDDLQQHRESITSVTVRHHLSRLQNDGLVCAPVLRHSHAPGRPKHVFSLTQQGVMQMPNNYQKFAANLFNQMSQSLPESQVNVILEGVADRLADEAAIPSGSMRDRLDRVTEYLTQHGYEAEWEISQDGFVLRTLNCPYESIAKHSDMLCQMDVRLISQMLGVIPRLQTRLFDGSDNNGCTYLIPFPKSYE